MAMILPRYPVDDFGYPPVINFDTYFPISSCLATKPHPTSAFSAFIKSRHDLYIPFVVPHWLLACPPSPVFLRLLASLALLVVHTFRAIVAAVIAERPCPELHVAPIAVGQGNSAYVLLVVPHFFPLITAAIFFV